MSLEEYNARWQSILKRYGADIGRNQGWGPDHLSYAGSDPTGRVMVINVPFGETLTSEARRVIIEEAERRYLI